jgi:hypothetical protein
MNSQSLPPSVSHSQKFPSTKGYINEDFTHFPSVLYQTLKRMLQNDEYTKTGQVINMKQQPERMKTYLIRSQAQERIFSNK